MNSVLKHDALKSNPERDYVTEIPTNRIKANPYQPRKEFSRSALYDLANSIKEIRYFTADHGKTSARRQYIRADRGGKTAARCEDRRSYFRSGNRI